MKIVSREKAMIDAGGPGEYCVNMTRAQLRVLAALLSCVGSNNSPHSHAANVLYNAITEKMGLEFCEVAGLMVDPRVWVSPAAHSSQLTNLPRSHFSLDI